MTLFNKIWQLFFAIRWVEDRKVADIFIDICSNMTKIIKFWEKLSKSKEPTWNSFSDVRSTVNDPLNVGCQPKICLSVFDHFVGLALKGLNLISRKRKFFWVSTSWMLASPLSWLYQNWSEKTLLLLQK